MDSTALQTIGQRMKDGLSIFYSVMDHCLHYLGYLPAGKILPEQDAWEFTEELHTERLLASQWLVRDASRIRSQIVPQVIELCNQAKEYHLRFAQDTISKTEMRQTLFDLQEIASRLESEEEKLQKWDIDLGKLYEEAVKKAAEQSVQTASQYYSWQDAAEKLLAVQESLLQFEVPWKVIGRLADNTVISLEKAQCSPSEIVSSMYGEAAIRHWESAAAIAENIMKLR